MSAALKDYAVDSQEGRQSLEVVTFKIDGRLFAVPVGSVREIRGWQPATPLPNAAPHVVGVLNLRGAIIAVYDLRKVIGLGSTEPTRSTVTIVVDTGDRHIGLLADAVSDILTIAPDGQRDPPATDMGTALVRKLLVREDSVISLINVAAVLG